MEGSPMQELGMLTLVFYVIIGLILVLVAIAISRIPDHLKQQVKVLEEIRDIIRKSSN